MTNYVVYFALLVLSAFLCVWGAFTGRLGWAIFGGTTLIVFMLVGLLVRAMLKT